MAKKMFPLRIGPLALYNLLYAISFLQSPEEMVSFLPEQLVWVGLNLTSSALSPLTSLEQPTSHLACSQRRLPCYTLPTHSLHDGTVSPTLDAMNVSDPAEGHPSILPEPASPFPIFSTNSASSSRMHYTSSGTPTHIDASSLKQVVHFNSWWLLCRKINQRPNVHPIDHQCSSTQDSPYPLQTLRDSLHPLYPSPVAATNS